MKGSTSWTALYTTRSTYHIFHTNKDLTHCSLLNSTARSGHVAWTPPSHPNFIVLLGGYDYATKFIAEILPGFEKWSRFYLFFVAGGGTFELRHSGHYACGIPDEDTIVMTGGYPAHDYVTR